MTFTTSVRNVESSDNSTSTPLGSSATFTGNSENVERFNIATITVYADEEGTIFIDAGQDGTNWDKTVSYSYENATSVLEVPYEFQSKFFRIRFTNGSVAQSVFRLQTILRVNDEAKLNSVIKYSGLQLSADNYDEFIRIRTGKPATLFDSNFTQLDQSLLWDEITTGTGSATHTTPQSYYSMDIGAGAGRVVRQTRQYFTYQPGKSFEILLTGVLATASVAGTVSRIGIFDDGSDKSVGTATGDGFFFQLSNTTLSVVKRSYISGSQVDTVINQTDWNIDTLDGNGISGVSINPNYRQIFVIAQEWLGVGSVSMGIVFDRAFIPCHQWNHANRINNSDDPTLPYTTRASLPLRYEIEGTSTSKMIQVCSSVSSNGGFAPSGKFIFDVDMSRNVNAGEVPMISLRLKSTGTLMRTGVRPTAIEALSEEQRTVKFKYTIYKFYSPASDPLTGASWTSADTNSAVEYDISATAVSLTGTYVKIKSGFISGRANSISFQGLADKVQLNSDIAGNTDYLVMTFDNVEGNGVCYTSLQWEEVY